MYILHLSDLHFGTKNDANRWYNQLATDLHEDLKCNSLDALLLSGDIASNSAAEEYEAAREFIINLMIDFRLRWPEVVIVPGNHDLNLGKAKEAYTPTRRTDYHGLQDDSHIINGEGEYVEVLNPEKYKQRFTYFRAFHETVVKKSYALEPKHQYTLHHFSDHDLLILGLNSAWQLDHHYTSRASINPDALSNAIAEINENSIYKNSRLKIAVWHHPLNSPFKDRITDHGFLELLAQNGFRLALHGHIHQANKEDFKYRPGRQIDIIAAGTFGAPVREWQPGYPLQYNLLKWEGKKLTVYTRKRIELYGAWQPDAMWVSSDGIDASSYYEIELFPPSTIGSRQHLPGYLKNHYQELSKAIIEGSIVPFLGADINLCDRPLKEKDSKPSDWVDEGPYPPTNLELAAYIDRETTFIDEEGCGYLQTVRCPLIPGTSLDELPKGLPPECPLTTGRITRLDLQSVSQYFQSKQPSPDRLKGSINSIYQQSSYQFNSLHKFLVRLIKEVYPVDTEKSGATPYPLIVTTCFDRTLERAFENESLPFDLVSYTSSEKQFIYQKFDLQDGGEDMSWTKGEIISEEKKHATFLRERPVILRLYGPVDWNNAQRGENFAMTEDHFLDYLACDISHKLPTKLWNKLLEGRLWFLGYSLSYWNLRFIIRQIRKEVEPNIPKWWAVQEKADILDRDLWSKNDVSFFSDQDIGSLEQYLKDVNERLTDELKELPKPPAKRIRL